MLPSDTVFRVPRDPLSPLACSTWTITLIPLLQGSLVCPPPLLGLGFSLWVKRRGASPLH